MFMEFTNPATSVSILNYLPNIKPIPKNNSIPTTINLCSALLKTLSDSSFLVFHGGSGSSKEEYDTAISYGVVKVNLDTDLQYAYCAGIRDYMISKKAYVLS